MPAGLDVGMCLAAPTDVQGHSLYAHCSLAVGGCCTAISTSYGSQPVSVQQRPERGVVCDQLAAECRDWAALRCRWTCEVTSLPVSLYDIVTRAYTSNDILVALSYTDSRTIYLHDNMTTPLGAWGPDDLTVANFRWACPWPGSSRPGVGFCFMRA